MSQKINNYAVFFNDFLVSPAGVVAPLCRPLSAAEMQDTIPQFGYKLRVVTQKNAVLVSGPFQDEKEVFAYLEDLIKQNKLCETLGVYFRRVPDSLRKTPSRIKVHRANTKKTDLELDDPVTYEKSCEAYAKYLETHKMWVDYIQSVLVK